MTGKGVTQEGHAMQKFWRGSLSGESLETRLKSVTKPPDGF